MGTPVHTPQWMAPEVIRMEGYGRPSDIWSFGSVMFEMLELGVPYGDEITLTALEAKLAEGCPPALSDKDGTISRAPKLVPLMNDCFASDPLARPTAAEIMQRL